MKRFRTLVVLFVTALLVAAVSQAAAQAPAKFSAGARVEVRTYGTDGKYEKGTITQVDDQRASSGNLKYLIHLDVPSPGSGASDVSAFENEVRALVAFTPFKVGSVVDVYYSPGVGRDRGTVRAVNPDGRYKIHFPGSPDSCDTSASVLRRGGPGKAPRFVERLEEQRAVLRPRLRFSGEGWGALIVGMSRSS